MVDPANKTPSTQTLLVQRHRICAAHHVLQLNSVWTRVFLVATNTRLLTLTDLTGGVQVIEDL
jgi:hypothetical protein